MKKPVRATLVFGLFSALAVVPLLWLFPVRWGLPFVVKMALWADLALYAVLLCRWSKTRVLSILFPLSLLLGIAAWPGARTGFILAAAFVFSWIRSGICFQAGLFRNLIAETVTILGSLLLIAIWLPGSVFTWSVGIWLFFLIQSLYFFFLPSQQGTVRGDTAADPFEQARKELERVLDDGVAG